MTSLLLLIDGYNVVSPIAAPGRTSDANWLHRERMRLIDRLCAHLPGQVRERTCVVFDAANPPKHRPSEFTKDGVYVQFAIGYPEADDLIEEIIFDHTSPKRLAVVSSDHRVQSAAKRRGAVCFDSQPWLDALLEDNVQLAIVNRGAGEGSSADQKPSAQLEPEDVSDWMKEFGLDD